MLVPIKLNEGCYRVARPDQMCRSDLNTPCKAAIRAYDSSLHTLLHGFLSITTDCWSPPSAGPPAWVQPDAFIFVGDNLSPAISLVNFAVRGFARVASRILGREFNRQNLSSESGPLVENTRAWLSKFISRIRSDEIRGADSRLAFNAARVETSFASARRFPRMRFQEAGKDTGKGKEGNHSGRRESKGRNGVHG